MSFSELPTNFVNKMNIMQNYNKSPVRILPTSGSSPVRENGYIKLALPAGSVLDLRTLSINFYCKTYVNADPSPNNKLVGLPKWTNSLISDLDIWINGRCVQKLSNYGFIYSLLQDYKSNYTAKCKQVGVNADPSVYTSMNNEGVITKYNTYVQTGDETANRFAGNYCWNDFIGFLACEPSIINTDLMGTVEIHIRLAPSSVLFAQGLTVNAGVITDSVGFEISNVVAYIDKIDFKDDRYYAMMNSVLNSEMRLRIPYKNYGFQTGDVITDTSTKNCIVKMTESCESLDKIIFTFMDNTVPSGKQTLQLGTSTNVLSSAAVTDVAGASARLVQVASGQIPKSLFNYTNLLANNDDQLLNTSLAFKRNGLGMGGDAGSLTTGTVQFTVNSQDLTHPLSLIEQYQQTMQAFELNEDDQKQINPAIKNIALYERDFYACALSTSHINNKDKSYTLVSGLDTQATSMNLQVRVQGARTAHANQRAIPVLITEMTSHLIVAPQRQIMPVR
jgi:hypothetical protein